MKLNLHFFYLGIIFGILFGSIVIMRRSSNKEDRMLNLISAQDETVFSALKYMSNPSDTTAQNNFIRSLHNSERAWQQIKH